MKISTFILIFLVFLLSCKDKNRRVLENKTKVNQNTTYTIAETECCIEIKYPLLNKTVSIAKSNLPIQECLVMNTSSVAFLNALQLLDKIKGVASAEYIYNAQLHEKIQDKTLQNLGSDNNWDFEKIISSEVKFIFCIYDPSMENTYQQLKNYDIQIIFIEEYLENSPLHRSGYLQLFGTLFNKQKEAQLLHKEISDKYNFNKVKTKLNNLRSPKILSKVMYGDIWYMPGGKSYSAQLYKDAGANYPWKNTDELGSLNLDFEEVFAKTSDAPIWLDASDVKSKSELSSQHMEYQSFEAYKTNQIYSLGGRVKGKANDFYETGVVRPDWVLKELNYIISHYDNIAADSLYFYKKLN